MIDLSIVIPMYNERDNVDRTLSLIGETMAGFRGGWELILVDDGSDDDTLAVARAAAERVPWLRVLSYERNRGRGRAMRTGFDAARGEIIITTDFDLSYSPDHILKIYDAFRENQDVDVVLGSAYMPGGTVKDVPFMRHAASRLGNRVLSFAMDGKVHTITCILRGYRRHVLESLELESEGKEIHLEILSKVLSLGYRVLEVPAHLRGRTGGKSKFKLKATSLTHLVFTFFERPMIVFGGLGALMLLLGIVVGAAIVFMRYSGTLNPERPLMTLMVLLVLVGIQVLTVGFIALQILKLRKEIYRIQAQNLRLEKLMRELRDDPPHE